jgi:mono/diheme cytochrome c family protein
MARIRKLLAGFVLSVIVAIGLISLYTLFEYTLVSDLRERIAGADAKDGVDLGGLLFDTRGCSGCHSLGSLSNATIGPDLSTIADTASAGEIRASIVNPDAVISGNCLNQPCPVGLMPDFGEILDEREIDALVAFLLQYGRSKFEEHDQQSN